MPATQLRSTDITVANSADALRLTKVTGLLQNSFSKYAFDIVYSTIPREDGKAYAPTAEEQFLRKLILKRQAKTPTGQTSATLLADLESISTSSGCRSTRSLMV